MGGGDKGLMEIAGKPMLEHVVARLAPQVAAVVINANGDPTRFNQFNLPVVEDTLQGHFGPLAGVLTGMRWARSNVPNATHVLTAPTDAPLLPADLGARLQDALNRDHGKIAIATSGGHKHPVVGLWPVGLADDLEQALHDGVRKVLQWTDRHGTSLAEFAFVERDGKSIDPFFNANTPEDLDKVRALIES